MKVIAVPNYGNWNYDNSNSSFSVDWKCYNDSNQSTDVSMLISFTDSLDAIYKNSLAAIVTSLNSQWSVTLSAGDVRLMVPVTFNFYTN